MKSLILSLAVVFSGCMTSVAVDKKDKKLDARCLKKPKTGRCRGRMTRYYFDNENSTCKEFIWGGCGGVVPFDTLKDCESSCL